MSRLEPNREPDRATRRPCAKQRRPGNPWQYCGTGVSPVVSSGGNSVSDRLLSLSPRAASLTSSALIVLTATSLVLSGCDRSGDTTPNTDTSPPAHPVFVDVTDRVGLDFVSACGPDRTYFMPEIMGSGCALLDYDNDGDLDIYLISAAYPPEAPAPTTRTSANRLFRHEPNHSFTDVTARSGLGHTGYGMGVAVGDYDNDGLVDIYVTNYGPNVLFKNAGNGRFIDVTDQAGVGDARWGTSAVFVDYDVDGFLDLLVINYVALDPNLQCFSEAGRRDYCGPERFPGASDVLYHNNGDHTFSDATATSGIGTPPGRRGLGAVCADLNDDGRIDLYVANDNQPNQAWINLGGGTFRDQGTLMGVAYNHAGQTEAGMGVVCCDLDEDADLDLFTAHLRGESHTLYENRGQGMFQDVSAGAGIVAPSARFTSFGVGPIDFDLDGDLDLAIVSGHVFRGPVESGAAGSPFWNKYAQPGSLLRNDGRGRFSDVGDHAGDFASTVQVGRGLAVGDLDQDGDPDLLTTAGCGRARVFYNEYPDKGHWLIVRAFDPALRRDAYAARVKVRAAGRDRVRVADPGYSYLSAGDPRAYFGLGDADSVDWVEVAWPGGPVERFAGGSADRVITLMRGEGDKIGE